jgi:hypothetical protein
VYVDLEKNITLTSIGQVNQIVIPIDKYRSLKRDSWWTLWTNKIDYFEYQVNQFGIKYPLIRETFSYFVGLAETSIALYKNSNIITNEYLYLSHKRIKKGYLQDDLYNPLNIVLDFRMRDACEYFKDCFFNDDNIYNDVITYINNNHFSNQEVILFLTRMIYPSYYFDIYEDILSSKTDEKSLERIIFRISSYESFIKKLYLTLKNYYNIPNIEWLNK